MHPQQKLWEWLILKILEVLVLEIGIKNSADRCRAWPRIPNMDGNASDPNYATEDKEETATGEKLAGVYLQIVFIYKMQKSLLNEHLADSN